MATNVTPLRKTESGKPKPGEADAAQSVRDLASAEKGVLRFITCGSVDDGKSTLIGRLLYDTKLIFEDQLASLKKDGTHLAMADIRDSIAELKHYRLFMGVLGGN